MDVEMLNDNLLNERADNVGTGEFSKSPYRPDDIVVQLTARLHSISAELKAICLDTDPLFTQVGRELQKVSSYTGNLTDAIMQVATSVGDEGCEKGILVRTGTLIQSVRDSLANGRHSLENSMDNVRELIGRITKFQCVNDQIDTISSRFNVVRVNFRIQCSSRQISEEMFKSLINDIDSLSSKLHSINVQSNRELTKSARKLKVLDRTITHNLRQFEIVTSDAQKVVSHAFDDIQHLIQGASVMIKEAGARSERISRKIDDVVVSIQFHDSMSQRATHVQHALDDICKLNSNQENITADQLGASWFILDLQQRQLEQIIKEVGSVANRIHTAFQVIEEEVYGLNTIKCDSQFDAIGPQQFLSTLFDSLIQTLFKFCSLLNESQAMLEQLRESARKTNSVTGNLLQLMENIRNIRENTRLQAANAIIMASNLGAKGRTINVLAKEINSLSGQTGEVSQDAEAAQLDINRQVAELLESSKKKEDSIDCEEVESRALNIGRTCTEVEQRVSEVSSDIEEAGSHIDMVRSKLFFLEELHERLVDIVGQIINAKELLDPWKDKASSQSADMEELIDRYTMEQERLVHGFDHEEEQEGELDDDEIFF